MTDEQHCRQDLCPVSGLHLAEIRIHMNAKEDAALAVCKVLEQKGVNALEDLDWFTVRNLLHYLRSL